FPGVEEFLKKYQAKAASEGVDPLGYYLPPFAYANLQVLQAAVEGTKSLDQDKLADWLRKNTIKTIVGDLAFGSNGEWKEARVLQIQFHDVKGSDLDQDRKSTRLNSSHSQISYAVFCLKKKIRGDKEDVDRLGPRAREAPPTPRGGARSRRRRCGTSSPRRLPCGHRGIRQPACGVYGEL